jgi:hypothetical protein
MAHFGIQAIPSMPPGQTDQNAWVAALQNGWISNPNVPLTQVHYLEKVTLTPPCDPLTAHTFTRRMLAFPLTINGPRGSEPDGKASWWTSYFNTKATGHAKRAWVQGHLLNHHIHGPGVAENLVPITDQLNRIMEKWAEKVVKDMVLAKGYILKYQVTADWRCGMNVGKGADWQGNASKHAQAMHGSFDSLQKGECLAPTSLQWEACVIQWDGRQWVEVAPVQFSGYEGIENGIFPNSWN